MNTPHTPGPWTVFAPAIREMGGYHCIQAHNDEIVARVSELLTRKETDANARLIAKAPIAPKLAEALRKARKVLKNRGGSTGYECLKEVNAALAEWDAQ